MKARFRSIFDRSQAIGEKAQNNQATLRDVAELAELYQQTIDTLDELSDNLPAEKALIARIDGKTSVKFADADKLAAWIAGVINGH